MSSTDSTAMRQERERAESTGTETIPSELPATPVGKSDSLVNAIAPKVTPWVKLWRLADPSFSPDSLYPIGVSPALQGGSVQPLKNVYPPPPEEQAVFLLLSAHSPGGRYNLIFDRYLNITESNGEVDISGEPDHAPLLLDLRGGTANQFETCGPSCGFDWGVWLSPTTFVLAGWQEAQGSRKQGRIKVYSLTESTATTYVTRPVSSGEFARYRAAWEASIASKFRGMKSAPPKGS